MRLVLALMLALVPVSAYAHPVKRTSVVLGSSAPAPVGKVSTITTQNSVTPTARQLKLKGTQNGFRVFTDNGPLSEEFYYLYYRADSGTVYKAKSYRYQGRVFKAYPGASISFGTSGSRSLKVAGITLPETTENPSGASGTANPDQNGPPYWTPTAPHIVLPGFNQAFSLTSASAVNIFIREYDGSQWTPIRSYYLQAGVAAKFRATYRQIALANYDATTVTVAAPSGSVIGGTSVNATWGITATGTTRNVTGGSESDFRAKIALAVAGDEIVLPSGTYTLTADITDATFAANEAASRQGGEGVIIRSATGNPADVTIIPNNTTNGWALSQNGAVQAMLIKGVTFNINTRASFVRFLSGIYRLEDVRITGNSTSTTSPSLEINASGGPLDFRALRTQVDDSVEDNFDGNGTGSDSIGVSTAQLIDCLGFDSGTTDDNQQIITTHNGLRLEVWGGEFYDARLNVVETDSNTTSIVHTFFAKFHDGAAARRAGMGSFTCYFCYNESGAAADAYTPKVGGYSVGGDIIRSANAGGNSVFRYASGTTWNATANKVTANDGRAFFPSGGGMTFDWNVVADSGEGIRVLNSSGPTGVQTFLYNNTIDSSPTALSFGDANNIPITMYNQATKGSTTGINTTVTHEAATTHNFNTIDPTIDADFVAGGNDTVSADAALDSNYIPTASGNSDDNGKTDLYDWIGGVDIQGFPVIYKLGVAPRGGRSRPIIRSGAQLYPEVWY